MKNLVPVLSTTIFLLWWRKIKLFELFKKSIKQCKSLTQYFEFVLKGSVRNGTILANQSLIIKNFQMKNQYMWIR